MISARFSLRSLVDPPAPAPPRSLLAYSPPPSLVGCGSLPERRDRPVLDPPGNIIRLAPPLCITAEQIDASLEIMASVLVKA